MINIIKELEGIKELIENNPEGQEAQLFTRLTKRCDRLICQQKARDKMGYTKMVGED